jgi:hypothetical protein
VVNEANTRYVVLIRLARKGPPWPSGSEYRTAKARAEELLRPSPPPSD